MLLGTIRLRIQSKPTAGDMVKQTPTIPYPALLSDHNTTGQIRKTESTLGSAMCRYNTVLTPALATSLALLKVRRLAAVAQPGIYQEHWSGLSTRESGDCRSSDGVVRPGPAWLPCPPSPAPGLPVSPTGPSQHQAVLSNLGVSATTHSRGGWSSWSHGSLAPQSLCTWEEAAGAATRPSRCGTHCSVPASWHC